MNKKTLLFIAFLWLAATGAAQTINVASYNVRYANPKDSLNGNGWVQRAPVIAGIIRYHDFDVFGAQEVLHSQLEDMSRLLDDYDSIGAGRDDGRTEGEYAPVFFKREMFTLLNSGTFWLSPTPDVPGVGWDALFSRICTWGLLRHNESGAALLFCNTHFDHAGEQARVESAGLILERIGGLAQEHPIILTGDFNADQNTPAYRSIAESGVVKDSYEAAEIRHAANGTGNGFNPARWSDRRIDHIFVSPEIRVLRYAVLTDAYWTQAAGEDSQPVWKMRVPSDHYPAAAQLELQ